MYKQCGTTVYIYVLFLDVELRLRSRCPPFYDFKLDRTGYEDTTYRADKHTEEDYWTDILLTEPDFYYAEHSVTTEKYFIDVSEEDPTRTIATEPTIVLKRPGHLRNLVTWSKIRYTQNRHKQHTKHKMLHTTDAMDEEDHFNTDEWSIRDFNL